MLKQEFARSKCFLFPICGSGDFQADPLLQWRTNPERVVSTK